MTMSNCTSEYLIEAKRASRPSYMALQLSQIILCTLSPMIFHYAAVKYKKVYYHPNIRTMINFYRFVTLCYCISFVIIESYHLLSRLIYVDCDLLVPVKTCIWFRVVQSWASVVLQLFYIGVTVEIMIERLLSACGSTRWLPRIIGLLLSILAFRTVGPSVPIDLASTGYLSNCASLANKSKAALDTIFFRFFIMDMISLGSFILLRIYIGCCYSVQRIKYDVNKSICRKELLRAFNLMIPNIIIHVVCYVYLSSFSMWLFSNSEDFNDPQMQFMISNSVPFYVFASPLVWCIVLHRQQRKIDIKPVEDQRDIYFKQLTSQWNTIGNLKSNANVPLREPSALPEKRIYSSEWENPRLTQSATSPDPEL